MGVFSKPRSCHPLLVCGTLLEKPLATNRRKHDSCRYTRVLAVLLGFRFRTHITLVGEVTHRRVPGQGKCAGTLELSDEHLDDLPRRCVELGQRTHTGMARRKIGQPHPVANDGDAPRRAELQVALDHLDQLASSGDELLTSSLESAGTSPRRMKEARLWQLSSAAGRS